MSVVQMLAGDARITRYPHPLKQAAEARFAPFRDHPAVTTYRRLSARGFAYNRVPEAMLSLDPHTLAIAPIAADPAQSAGGEQALREWFVTLRDFAAVTRFDAWMAQQSPTHARAVNAVRPQVTTALSRLERYLGAPLGETHVVLGPLLHDGGFAATRGSDAHTQAWAFIGPQYNTTVPDFGDAQRLEGLISHEFAHTLINRWTAEHPQAVARSAHQFTDMREAMRRQAYGNWPTVVNESIIRAITARLVAQAQGETAGDALVFEEVARGFRHLPTLIAALRSYEGERSRYPTLRTYMPQLLAAFEPQVPS